MYEAVHVRPEGDGAGGESTGSRVAVTAREFGYDGIVVRNHSDRQPEYEPGVVAEETGVDVVRGIEIRAEDPQQASGYVGNYRPDYTIVAVHGGTNALNRFAVEQPKVDVLAHPMRGDGDFNHVLARAAAENGVRVEVNLARVLRTSGGRRVQVLSDLRKLRELIAQYDAPYVITAGPRSHLQLRAPRELVAVADEIGLDEDAGLGPADGGDDEADGHPVERGLEEWRRLAERNRERRSEAFIEPGVRRGRHEEEH